jgi:hypothetical protein
LRQLCLPGFDAGLLLCAHLCAAHLQAGKLLLAHCRRASCCSRICSRRAWAACALRGAIVRSCAFAIAGGADEVMPATGMACVDPADTARAPDCG